MLNVMKASKIELAELKKWTPKDWMKWRIEQKINGFRLTRIDGKWVSKQGKSLYNTDKILSAFDGRAFERYDIDGELSGNSWNQTMTLFRSSVADVSKYLPDARFYVFDLIDPDFPDEPWQHRQQRLDNLFKSKIGFSHPHIRLVRGATVSEFQFFKNIHLDHLAHGCDGSVLKHIDSPYEYKRSKHWLKVKPVREMDCLIVGFKEGKGKYVGTLGSLEVRIPINDAGDWSEQVTNVSGMTDEDRHYIWKHRKSLKRKIVEVKYRELSAANRLIEGRVSRLRLDKDVI